MQKIKGVVNIIGLIVKYSAIVMCVIKGIQVMFDELKKIDFDDNVKTKSLENE
jgi:hypothetical protein